MSAFADKGAFVDKGAVTGSLGCATDPLVLSAAGADAATRPRAAPLAIQITIPQIVAITKHSLQSATRILEVYLDPTQHLAEQAIHLFENASATEFANRLQTSGQKNDPRTNKRK